MAIYETIIEWTVPVSSTRVAEAAKLLENIYCFVNIALVNGLITLFDRIHADIWEVIEAAKTKLSVFRHSNPDLGWRGAAFPAARST